MTRSIKGAVFKQVFPHYYQSKFIVGDSEVDFVLGAGGLIITVDALFFKNPAYTKFLGLSNQEEKFLKTHGFEKYKLWKHFDDFQQRRQKELDQIESDKEKKRKQRLAKKLASEHIGKVLSSERILELKKKAKERRAAEQEQTMLQEREWEKEREAQRELDEETKLAEKQDRERMVEAELVKLDLTKWQPRLWSARGTVPDVIALNSSPIESNFQVYVTETDSFPSQFPTPKTSWNANTDNILTEKFDVKKDKYFCALGAAYTISYKAGFSKEHMQEKGIAGSLARYAVYFHLNRFLRFPNLLNLLTVEKQDIQKNIPIRKIWKKKFIATQEIPELWIEHQKNKANIRHIRADYYSDGGGQHGIYYEEVEKVTNTGDHDWQQFIRETSDGFTIYGQKLLEKAIESYCYAILGAQAQTRWEIVNDGAHSGQTQDVFRTLAQDTIVDPDTTKSVSNMRTAIKDTNVQLNFMVSPGVSLLPSNMVLNKKIPNFNNILEKADKYMKFGVNTSVNTEKPDKTQQQQNLIEYKQHMQQQKKKRPDLASESTQHDIVEHPESNTMTYVVLGVAISLITKFIVYELL